MKLREAGIIAIIIIFLVCNLIASHIKISTESKKARHYKERLEQQKNQNAIYKEQNNEIFHIPTRHNSSHTAFC